MNENITIRIHCGLWQAQKTLGAVPREGDTLVYRLKTFKVSGSALFDLETGEIHIYGVDVDG